MKILFIGDVSARPGRLAIKAFMSEYRDKVDLVIANAENAAHGLGVTKEIVDELSSYGVDFLTSGNDIWRQQSIIPYLDDPNTLLIRPLNYPDYFPGIGYKVIEKNGKKVLIINLMGQTFMKEEVLNPYHTIDKFLKDLEGGNLEFKREDIDIIFVDFHAEATSEKVAMGYFLDGRVNVVAGTHTHVQTSDERILKNNTAYITDTGMSGAVNGVLWVSYETVIKKIMNPYKFERFQVEESKPWEVNSIEVDIDEGNIATSIKRVNYRVD